MTVEPITCPVLVHFTDETCIAVEGVELVTVDSAHVARFSNHFDCFKTFVAVIGGERYTLRANARTGYQMCISARWPDDAYSVALVQLSVDAKRPILARGDGGLMTIRLPEVSA